MNTAVGKISRLPKHLREELNRRLERKVPGPQIAAWLNSLTEVRTLLRESFQSRPINLQNISNWRRTGFAEWQARQDLLAGLRTVAEDAADIASALGSVTEHAARLLALHFTRILCPSETIRGQSRQTPGLPEPAIKLLCQMSTAIAALRRGDHAHTRLQLQQEAPPPQKTSPHRSHPSPKSHPSTPSASPPPQPEIKPNQAPSTPPSPPHHPLPQISPANPPEVRLSPVHGSPFPNILAIPDFAPVYHARPSPSSHLTWPASPLPV